VEGELGVDGQAYPVGSLIVLRAGTTPRLEARVATRVALIGGAPMDGPRHIWWNFVSSSLERMEQAKADWRAQRFPRVPGETEFIPLPDT
jgi:redox-sensitive bicupin YhaK (pirin superfamily)